MIGPTPIRVVSGSPNAWGCFPVSKRTIFRLKSLYPSSAPPSFDLVDKWRSFVADHRVSVKSVKVPTPVATVGKDGADEDAVSHSAYIEARARRTKVQAEMAEIQLAVTKREIVWMSEVKALIDHIGAVYRGRILKLKTELASSCAGLNELAIEKIAGEKLNYALEAVALPEDFALPKNPPGVTSSEKYSVLLDVLARATAVPRQEHPDQWAAKHVRLNSHVSEFFDPDASPYFVQPFRRMFDNSCREICIIAPPGTGKTVLFEAGVCYLAHQDPGDVLITSKDEDLLEQWLDTKLNPILSRCAPLADYLPRSSDRQKKLLILKHLFIVARAVNESGLQQISVRYCLGDEVWLWDKGLIGYLRKRTHDRYNGKVVLVSQAGFAKSEWEQACAEGDQYHYHWICKCGVRQRFNFDANLKWNGDEKKDEIDWPTVKATTRLVCPHCGESYADTPENRRSLSSSATWELTQPGEDSLHETYTVPALANFRVPWFDLVREFLKARRAWGLGDQEPWMQFVTQRKSEFWKGEHETEDSQLKTSMYSWQSYTAGQKIDGEMVRFMTIDRQLAHYWVCIRAWREGGASQLLRYTMVMSQDELRALQLTYKVEDRHVFEDSAYDSTEVYAQCARFGWWAVLGTNENGFAFQKKDLRGRPAGTEYRLYSQIRNVQVGQMRCQVIMLASERLKDIMTHLRDGKSLPWEVPSDVPELYLKQINGEVKKETVEPKTKRAVFRWVQVKANHSFDTEYYQIGAALIANILRLD